MIVTRERESIRLSSTTLELILEDLVIEHLSKKQARYERGISAYRADRKREVAEASSRLASCDSALGILGARVERLRLRSEQLARELKQAQQANAAPNSMPAVAERVARCEAALSRALSAEFVASRELQPVRTAAWLQREAWGDLLRREAATPTCNEIMNYLESSNCSEFYFNGLPAAALTTQSDAAGEFSLRVPDGKSYVLAAHTTRVVGTGTEDYYWLVRIPEFALKGEKLLLSNETLSTGASPISLFHVSEVPAYPSRNDSRNASP